MQWCSRESTARWAHSLNWWSDPHLQLYRPIFFGEILVGCILNWSFPHLYLGLLLSLGGRRWFYSLVQSRVGNSDGAFSSNTGLKPTTISTSTLIPWLQRPHLNDLPLIYGFDLVRWLYPNDLLLMNTCSKEDKQLIRICKSRLNHVLMSIAGCTQ